MNWRYVASMPSTDGVLLLILRDLEGLLKAVDDGQQVFGKLLDAELAGL